MQTVQEKIELLHEKLAKVKAGGGEKRVEKQHAQGKMTARERLAKLFDDNSFVELDQFVKHRCVNFGQEKKELPGEGVVTGYGTIDGRLVYAFAQDFTVEGGSLGEMHAAKIVKVQRLAMKMGAPIVGINDSGGARIQEAVDALAGYGKIFFENTNASGVIPQISVIMGPCAGGAVYSPALTDFIYMVKNTSQMFITGPAVIKSVTGEEVTAEDLGGAMAHNSVSGVAHFAAEDEDDCIAQIRYLLGFLPSNNMEDAPLVDTGDDPTREDEGLNSLLPDNSNMPYDMKDVIAATVDNGEYYEVQPFYATNIITCFAGTNQEWGGIIRHGAKMLYAYSEATVPKITVITRKAYGGSYLAMCSQDLGADQVYAWPTSEIAVMGPAGAANIIFKKDEDKDAKTAKYVEEFATPYKAAERGFVDVVIEPKQTRPAVINALAMLASKRENRAPKKHGNIPL